MTLCRSVLSATLALALAGVAGCNDAKSDPVSGHQGRKVATAEMQIRLPDGSTLSTLNYDVTGGPSNIVSPAKSGTVNVGNSATVKFRVGGLPVGPGYNVALTGTSSDGTMCAGTAGFAITDNLVTNVILTLFCGDGMDDTDDVGDAIFDVAVEQNDGCPVITAITALPLEVYVGSSLSLSAQATSPTVAWSWTGAGGSFSASGAAATNFTCSTVGDHELTVAISEGTCTSDWDVTVTCTAPEMAICGDGAVGGSEQCDSGVNNTNACAYGLMSCTVCNTSCQSVAGTVAYCGDGAVTGPEACDGGANCTATCTIIPPASCGNGTTEAGETCDDGNTTTESCAYGLTSCTVCDAACQSVPGATAYCGDGTVNGTEQCDGAPECSATCTTVTVSACDTCREANCRDYQGSGIDLVAGCFENPDPTWNQKCVDVVDCAFDNECAYSPATVARLEPCYCGTAQASACRMGVGVNGPCRAQIEAAANSTDPGFIATNITNLSLPVGNAEFLLGCDFESCQAECVP